MLPVALNFEDSAMVQMTVSKRVVAYFHEVEVLFFAVAMELDRAFSERHGIEPLAQPLHSRKKTFQENISHALIFGYQK